MHQVGVPLKTIINIIDSIMFFDNVFINIHYSLQITVADPGFPIGGAPTHWGGTNLQCIHFLAKTYVKMKEIDPVGGGGRRRRRPPGSANGLYILKECSKLLTVDILEGSHFFVNWATIYSR